VQCRFLDYEQAVGHGLSVKQSFSTSVGRVEVLVDEQSGVVSVCRFDTEGRAVAAAIEGFDNTDLAGLLVHQAGVPATEANDIASAVTRKWRERVRPSPTNASPVDASPAGAEVSAAPQAGERESVLKRVYMTAFLGMFGCILAGFVGVSFDVTWILFLGLFVLAVVCGLISLLTNAFSRSEDSPRFVPSTGAQHDAVWSLAAGPWQGVQARNRVDGMIEVARVHRGEFCRYMVDEHGRTTTVESRRVRSPWEARIMWGGIGLFVIDVIVGVIHYRGGPAPTWSAIPAIVGFAAAAVTAVRQPFPENYVPKDGSWTEIGRVEGEG
jgi:hypothetical protein